MGGPTPSSRLSRMPLEVERSIEHTTTTTTTTYVCWLYAGDRRGSLSAGMIQLIILVPQVGFQLHCRRTFAHPSMLSFSLVDPGSSLCSLF